MTLRGTVRNGVIELDPPEQLPEGTRVAVVVQDTPARSSGQGPTLGERLLKHAGTLQDLPADLAEQHDHYIHGTPKR